VQAKKGPLVIGGEAIKAGQTREIDLQFGESYFGSPVSIPLYVIRARKNGPRVFVTGAIHGDEMNGMGIVRELLYDKPPKLLQGSLILIPAVNIFGLERHSRYMPDRRDLNRCFPGLESGSATSRLAYSLFNEVVRQCDFGIDFHSAAVRRTNYPNIRANTRHRRTLQLARDFGCELIVDSKGPTGSLRRIAVEQGVPTIILEAGEVWRIQDEVTAVGVRGVMNVLRKLEMAAGEPERPPYQVIARRTTWVRAQKGGILQFHAQPGQLVHQYECLATNSSVFGKEQTSLLSPSDGIVLGMTTMPAVSPGAPVYHIAELPRRSIRQIERQKRKEALEAS
jgi:hypothetical protein